jgi:SAM-dependent methyltransferase
LRAWFTEGKDAVLKEIDGIDIGWGGSQRWTTANMLSVDEGAHLDFACGYGTFLAQLGWRFPGATLFGLNIDFSGAHASIRELLEKAEVSVVLIQADACAMPFADRSLDSVSCFLGLQDIKIGFGEAGLDLTLSEARRVLRPNGVLTLVDEFADREFDRLLDKIAVKIIWRGEFALETKWSRRVAEKAIVLYSKGWVVQARIEDSRKRARLYDETYERMHKDMEQQLCDQGFYVPHAPVRMVIARKNE